MAKKVAAVICLLTLLSTGKVTAAPGDFAAQEQLRRAKSEQQARQERLTAPRVQLESVAVREKVSQITGEKFYISGINFTGDSLAHFPWLVNMAENHSHRHLNLKEINELVTAMNNKLISKGYVTTLVDIPEQNISEGTLTLRLITGRISEITFSQDSSQQTWRNAFPTRPGRILNLRDLEQGLEQMKRLPSQDITMQLEPAEQPGYSRVILTVKKQRPTHLTFSLDDSGLSGTGKLQMGATLTMENPLQANDILNLNFNHDAASGGAAKGSRGHSLYYSIPAGYTTFSLSAGQYDYRQTVHSQPEDFYSSGKSSNFRLTINQVLTRNQTEKISLDTAILTRSSHSYINDAEIFVQGQNTTALELGLNYRKYYPTATLNLRLAQRLGLGWFGAQPENYLPDAPRSRYNIWLLDADYLRSIKIGGISAQYSVSFHAQQSSKRLLNVEAISIGNRYTVRGFNGENTLLGESGWYLRNELSVPLGKSTAQIYAGLDVGAVYGKTANEGAGRSLIGAALGIRGGTSFAYDIFLATPLYKPQYFKAKKLVWGFQLLWRI